MPVDPLIAERLFAGKVTSEDAPPGYEEVAALLEALRAEPTADELACEAETVATMAETLRSHSTTILPTSPRSSSMSHRFRAKLALVPVAAALVLTTGAAFAGGLPDQAQSVAAAMLDKVGVSIPEGAGADNARQAALDESDGPTAAEQSSEAEAKHVAATAYAEAVQEWTKCVATRAASQGDDSLREEGDFDPTAGCGERPTPADFRVADVPAPAVAGKAKAEANHAAATAYASAVREWTSCVREHASKQGGESTREQGFDPRTACGAHPSPAAFGLGRPAEVESDAETPEQSDRGSAREARSADRPGSAGRSRATGKPEGAVAPGSTRGSERSSGPRNAGPPAETGPPPDIGRPSGAEPPVDPGPPTHPGPPSDEGAPADTGAPADPGPPAGIPAGRGVTP